MNCCAVDCPSNYRNQTMHRLALAFGPIEHFGEYVSRDIGQLKFADPLRNYCAHCIPSDEMLSEPTRIHPHDAPRSPVMAKGIWEIKWKHREDCVAAIMVHTLASALRHLSLTYRFTDFASCPPYYGYLASSAVELNAYLWHRLSPV